MKNEFNKLYIMLGMMGLLSIIGCTKEVDSIAEPSASPVVSETLPAMGASNTLVTITGSGLGSVNSIVFSNDSVVANFNPVFNTDNAILLRVPTDAIPGEQNIMITNSSGITFSVPFNVLGFATITDVSNYNFIANGELTLIGKNLSDVSAVTFAGTTTALTIVSKTATELVLKFPETDLNYTKLDITNAAGLASTDQEFVNIDNAYQIFTDDYQNGFQNGSWGPAEVSGEEFKSGEKSFKVTYVKGNWWANGLASWSTGVDYSADYKYLSFWVKGGAAAHTFYITGDMRVGGYGNADRTAPIEVPANVWTYFKIPLAEIELWKNGTNFKQLGFWVEGPDNQDETLYFDDVILIKE